MKLKELREKNGITQKQIANFLGISQQAYNKYETNQNQPTIENLIKLANFYHISVDNLIENSTPYLLDLSTFTQAQLELIEKIKNCNEKTILQIGSYIDGLKSKN